MKQQSGTHLLGMMAVVLGGALLAPSIAAAQRSERPVPAAEAARNHEAHGGSDTTAIPADARPPKGMCRIWLNDVPASQQPAATDCATAVRNRPHNGRVLFGDDFSNARRDSSRKPLPDVKGFLQMKKPASVFIKHPA